MSRTTITERTGERLIRLAHEMEDLANRLKDEGYGDSQADVRRVSTALGRAGRELLDVITVRKAQRDYKNTLRAHAVARDLDR